MSFLRKVIGIFSEAATTQEKKGLEKYGQELDPFDPKHDWLQMAQEELVDGFKYLAAERERRNEYLITALNRMESIKVSLKGYAGPKFLQYVDPTTKNLLYMIKILDVTQDDFLAILGNDVEIVPVHAEYGEVDKRYMAAKKPKNNT